MENRSTPTAMSSAGDIFRTGQVSGILTYPDGRRIRTAHNFFTMIDPGSNATVLISFQLAQNEKIKGTQFTFTTELVRLNDDRTTNVSVGLSGVELN